MTELEKIATAFHDCCHCPDQQKISENGVGMSREIRASEKLRYRVFRIEPDNANIFPYFRHEEGLNSMCDYLIFIETSDIIYAYAVELKKASGDPRQQLDRSEAFLTFFIERMRLSDRLALQKSVKIGKVGITDNNIRPTTRNNGIVFDTNRFAQLGNRKTIYLDIWVDGLDK